MFDSGIFRYFKRKRLDSIEGHSTTSPSPNQAPISTTDHETDSHEPLPQQQVSRAISTGKWLKSFTSSETEASHATDLFKPAVNSAHMPQPAVCIWRGDITRLNSLDGIVNAANPRLILRGMGGISGAIGRGMTEPELDEYETFREDYLGSDELRAGSSCSLGRFKGALIHHAVAPRYHRPTSPLETDVSLYLNGAKLVYDAVEHLLTCESGVVAIPLIGTGIYGQDKMLCAWAIVRAVKDYLKTNNRPRPVTSFRVAGSSEDNISISKQSVSVAKQRGVVLVAFDDADVKAWEAALSHVFGDA